MKRGLKAAFNPAFLDQESRKKLRDRLKNNRSRSFYSRIKIKLRDRLSPSRYHHYLPSPPNSIQGPHFRTKNKTCLRALPSPYKEKTSSAPKQQQKEKRDSRSAGFAVGRVNIDRARSIGEGEDCGDRA